MAEDESQAGKAIVRQTNGITNLGTAGVGGSQPTDVATKPWYFLLAVRAGRAGLQALGGSSVVTTSGLSDWAVALVTGHPPAAADFQTHLVQALAVTVGAVAASLVQNGAEFLTQIDKKYPQWRA